MPEHRSLDLKGAALALLLSALWGANPVAIKLGLSDVAPLRMALLRFTLSALAIFAFAMASGRRAVLLGERVVYIAKTVRRVDPVRLMLYQSIIGSVGFFLISVTMEAGQPTRWTATLTLSIIFQGVIIGGFNFVVNAWLLKVYRPSALSTVALTTPIWGVLIAAALGGEGLVPELLFSTLLVVAGIALTMLR